MTYLSDTLTVGLVLILLFGSIALFLYTRVQQAEQKLSLLESILLDVKMASAIKSYEELPLDPVISSVSNSCSSVSSDSCVIDVSNKTDNAPVTDSYTPFEENPAHKINDQAHTIDDHAPKADETAYTPFEENPVHKVEESVMLSQESDSQVEDLSHPASTEEIASPIEEYTLLSTKESKTPRRKNAQAAKSRATLSA
jgi:hypothetical protein